MKTATTAAALIMAATFASADDTSFAMIDREVVGNGQIEIVTRQTDDDHSLYTRFLVRCLPMAAGVMAEAGSLDDLGQGDGSVAMEDVVRGTLRHNIANYACNNG